MTEYFAVHPNIETGNNNDVLVLKPEENPSGMVFGMDIEANEGTHEKISRDALSTRTKWAIGLGLSATLGLTAFVGYSAVDNPQSQAMISHPIQERADGNLISSDSSTALFDTKNSILDNKPFDFADQSEINTDVQDKSDKVANVDENAELDNDDLVSIPDEDDVNSLYENDDDTVFDDDYDSLSDDDYVSVDDSVDDGYLSGGSLDTVTDDDDDDDDEPPISTPGKIPGKGRGCKGKSCR
eukprot:CAMPEP_0182419300 /NCGR_PEP_ID=MMETSP1167-20130531/3759_1 /TAXON_ID=2988 /ORGANISM="Mallomonas Sp, Strain CCMP3275" /LENGTH=240 /DNA_ID=CAMNT_0024594129 /DNA_START=70 /DNA_END=792 /DNA_ORIENTATION=-